MARSRGGRGLHTHPLSWEGAGSKHSTSPAEIAASVQVESRLLLIVASSAAAQNRAKRVKRQALPPLKAENTRITVGVQQPWCCCCSRTDDGPDGGDLHGDDGLPRADGPLHPHLVPHLPGEEGGDEARQPVQGQLRVQDGQIQLQDS